MRNNHTFKLVVSIVIIASLGLASSAIAQTGSAFRSSGRIFGPGIRGQVQFEQQMRGGRLLRVLRVDIENAPPFATVPIIVNGDLLTAHMVNQAGRARVVFRSPEFIDGADDGIPLPVNFTALRTGSIVRVGNGTAIIFDRRGGNGIPDPPDVQTVVISGQLTPTANSPMEGTVVFRARLRNGQPLDRTFTVNLSNATPGQEVFINFNNSVIATGTADLNGLAAINLRTVGFSNPPFDGAMPATFPNLQAGNSVRIGNVRVPLVSGPLPE